MQTTLWQDLRYGWRGLRSARPGGRSGFQTPEFLDYE